MTSILTNTAAMSALSSLTSTQAQLSKTQAQISSGLAVETASDNEAYWSIGKTMSAQVAGLTAVNQGLGLTNSIADVTAAALNSIKSSLDKMQADVVSAGQSGVDLTAVQADISAQQQSIIAVANSATFNGVNWLINKTSLSSNETKTYTIDVSQTEYDKLLMGQSANSSATFNIKDISSATATQNGIVYSQTVTSDKSIGVSDASDGSLTKTDLSYDFESSGDTRLSSLINVAIPTGMSGNRVSTTEFRLTPLTLFSDGISSATSETDVYYDHMQYPTKITKNTYTTSGDSYTGFTTSASAGILDQSIQIIRQVAEPPVSGGGATSTQSVVDLDDSGGSSYNVTTGLNAGSSGSYTLIENESVLTINVIGMSDDEITAAGHAIQTSVSGIINASSVIGGLQNQIANQIAFNSSLSDALTSGIGSLVDADMNVASTRLQALQTQQQLGIQALSMANQNSQLILKLFQAA